MTVAAGTAIVIGLYACRAVDPLPELASNLPAEYKEGERVFRERVQQRFPIGSPVKAVVEALQSQGFEVDADAPNGHQWAVYSDKSWMCDTRWFISWQKGASEELVAIDASYGASCL